MSKSELEIHSTDSVQLYGAVVVGDDPGCQDFTQPVKLVGVRIVDEKWLVKVVAERDELLASQGDSREFSQFLTAVMDAAGLVRHGRQSKELSEYLGSQCMKYRLTAAPRPAARVLP